MLSCNYLHPHRLDGGLKWWASRPAIWVERPSAYRRLPPPPPPPQPLPPRPPPRQRPSTPSCRSSASWNCPASADCAATTWPNTCSRTKAPCPSYLVRDEQPVIPPTLFPSLSLSFQPFTKGLPFLLLVSLKRWTLMIDVVGFMALVKTKVEKIKTSGKLHLKVATQFSGNK